MFIVSITYTSSLEKIDALLDDHANFLKEQYAKGNFSLSGRKVPRSGGVIISALKSKKELEAVLVQDPFYQADVAKYDVTEFVPTMAAQELKFLVK